MSGEPAVELVITVEQASVPEWFVLYFSEGQAIRKTAPIGTAIKLPAGVSILDYGPVLPTAINLGHSISTGTAR